MKPTAAMVCFLKPKIRCDGEGCSATSAIRFRVPQRRSLGFTIVAAILLCVFSASSLGQTLTSGETVQGSISAPNEEDRYQLNLTAGEPYYVVAAYTGGGSGSFTPRIQLYRPDGSFV